MTVAAGPPQRPKDPFSLRGRNVLITGAARGIGYATAVRMIEAGARVMLNDVDGDALDEAAANLVTDDTVVVEAFQADVSELEQIRALVEQAVDVLGSLDVLVNNAGFYEPTPLDTLDPQVVDKLLDVNTKGLLYTSAEAAKVMRPGSAIVHVSSLGGIRPPFSGLSVYHASKGAIDSLTRDMALEWVHAASGSTALRRAASSPRGAGR